MAIDSVGSGWIHSRISWPSRASKSVEYSHVLPKWKVLTGPHKACDIFSKKVLVGDTYGFVMYS